VNQLKDIGPPPYAGNLRRAIVLERRLLGRYGGEYHGSRRGALGVVVRNLLLSPEYTLVDRINYFRGILDSIDLLFPELLTVDLFHQVPRVDVPVWFMLGRHGARELTPPGSVADATPPWRPQIKSWGCVDPVRTESPLPVGVWDPYVHPAYGYGVGSGSSGNGTGHARRAAFAVPGGYVGPPARAPAAGPVPVPVPVPVPALALALALALATPASPLAIPDLSTPPVAPPGWYPIDDDPGRTAWWSGSLWSQPYRWNGVAWYPE